MGNPLHVAFPSFYRPRREATYNLGPLPTRAFLSPLCASAAPRQFACLPRVSACGRKSSRHPPPPNRTSTGMCQGEREREISAEAESRVHNIPVGFLRVFASRRRDPTGAAGFLFSLIRCRHACLLALHRPHCMFSSRAFAVDPTSVSVLFASVSSATSGVAVSPRGTPSRPSWPARPHASFVMSCSFFGRVHLRSPRPLVCFSRRLRPL